MPGKSSQIPYEVDPITMLIVQMEKLERQRGNLPKVTLKKKKGQSFFLTTAFYLSTTMTTIKIKLDENAPKITNLSSVY